MRRTRFSAALFFFSIFRTRTLVVYCRYGKQERKKARLAGKNHIEDRPRHSACSAFARGAALCIRHVCGSDERLRRNPHAYAHRFPCSYRCAGANGNANAHTRRHANACVHRFPHAGASACANARAHLFP